MKEIDLRRFDLNLLVVFDVLMIERSVTRAAERLGRTQSAVSHSLSRLRDQFGDPLLIKSGLRMQPTAFALDLIEQARPMLGGIQRVISPQHIFDPSNSLRVFRIASPDFTLTLFADLLCRLRSEAPSVSVEWTAPREPTLLDVPGGLIDIAILPQYRGAGIGTLLLKDLVDESRSKKVPIELKVSKSNTAAARLYERMGFIRLGEDAMYYEMMRNPE